MSLPHWELWAGATLTRPNQRRGCSQRGRGCAPSDTSVVRAEPSPVLCVVTPADPSARPFTLALGSDYLGALRGLVGGDVETCDIDGGLTVWFRDGARGAGLALNANASALAATSIYGDAVVTAFDTDEVGNLELSAGQMEALTLLIDPRM